MHLVDTTVFYSPTSGGVRRYLNEKHAWLGRTTNWQHSLVVPGAQTHLEPGGVCTLRGTAIPGTFNYRLPLSPWRWSRMLDALEPDLIEAGDAFHPAWCALGVAQRRRIPAVAFFHSDLPALIKRRIGLFTDQAVTRYLRLLYERMDLVLAPSELMCGALRNMGIRNVALQPLGVDAEVFNPRRRNGELRALLGLRPETRLLAYAGRFSGEKNIPQLVTAFELLGKEYHLLLIGGDELRGVSGNATRLPYRRDSTELAALLASVDACIHAGTAETFGLFALEAMACGRPMVGVKAGAIPELVDDEVGRLADDARPCSLARAVRKLFDHDTEQLGAAARTRVESRHTWQHVLQQQQQLYASLAGASIRPATADLAEPRPVFND